MTEQKPLSEEIKPMIQFLCGEHELEINGWSVAFNEAIPGRKGRYWWRSQIRRWPSEIAALEAELAQAVDHCGQLYNSTSTNAGKCADLEKQIAKTHFPKPFEIDSRISELLSEKKNLESRQRELEKELAEVRKDNGLNRAEVALAECQKRSAELIDREDQDLSDMHQMWLDAVLNARGIEFYEEENDALRAKVKELQDCIIDSDSDLNKLGDENAKLKDKVAELEAENGELEIKVLAAEYAKDNTPWYGSGLKGHHLACQCTGCIFARLKGDSNDG